MCAHFIKESEGRKKTTILIFLMVTTQFCLFGFIIVLSYSDTGLLS